MGSRVNQNYAGLSRYVDTTDNENKYGMFAPSLIIALTQEETDFDSNGGTESTGRFGLNEALADGELGVLAKSELYFSRPRDTLASHFLRGDEQIEHGNRDRETPHDASPPTPPGIRITYHGGSNFFVFILLLVPAAPSS